VRPLLCCSNVCLTECARAHMHSVPSLSRRAVLLFEFEGDPTLLEVHVFTGDVPEDQQPVESGDVVCPRDSPWHRPIPPFRAEEMRPQWFAADSIPYDAMWLVCARAAASTTRYALVA
jgi:hypothetical protein